MIRQRILHALQTRTYGAAAAVASPSSVPAVAPQSMQVQKSPGGLTVASEDNLEPVSRLMAVVKAGSRCELSHQKGSSHALRRVATLSSTGSSQFMLEKKLQQMGANLSVTGTREHVIYTIEVLRDRVLAAGELLGSVVTGHVFKSWEMGGANNMIQLDREMAAQDPFVEVSELIHAAAYRTGSLGNSLFSNDHFKLSADLMDEYINGTYSPERMAVYGQGVGQEDMVDIAGTFSALPGGATDSSSSFKGSEIRKDNFSASQAVAMIAGEGASVSSADVYTYGVLEQLLGCGPSITWSEGQCPLNSAVSKATSGTVAVSTFNASYSDSGLFGVQLVGEPGQMETAANAALATIVAVSKSGPGQALEGAKMRLKASVTFTAESSRACGLARAVSLLGEEGVGQTLDQVCKSIDSVTSQQVQQAAKKLTTEKLAMASVGNLSHTPYLDDLKR